MTALFSGFFVSRPGLDYVDLGLGVFLGLLLSNVTVRQTLWSWAVSKLGIAGYVSIFLTLLTLFGSWFAGRFWLIRKGTAGTLRRVILVPDRLGAMLTIGIAAVCVGALLGSPLPSIASCPRGAPHAPLSAGLALQLFAITLLALAGLLLLYPASLTGQTGDKQTGSQGVTRGGQRTKAAMALRMLKLAGVSTALTLLVVLFLSACESGQGFLAKLAFHAPALVVLQLLLLLHLCWPCVLALLVRAFKSELTRQQGEASGAMWGGCWRISLRAFRVALRVLLALTACAAALQRNSSSLSAEGSRWKTLSAMNFVVGSEDGSCLSVLLCFCVLHTGSFLAQTTSFIWDQYSRHASTGSRSPRRKAQHAQAKSKEAATERAVAWLMALRPPTHLVWWILFYWVHCSESLLFLELHQAVCALTSVQAAWSALCIPVWQKGSARRLNLAIRTFFSLPISMGTQMVILHCLTLLDYTQASHRGVALALALPLLGASLSIVAFSQAILRPAVLHVVLKSVPKASGHDATLRRQLHAMLEHQPGFRGACLLSTYVLQSAIGSDGVPDDSLVGSASLSKGSDTKERSKTTNAAFVWQAIAASLSGPEPSVASLTSDADVTGTRAREGNAAGNAADKAAVKPTPQTGGDLSQDKKSDNASAQSLPGSVQGRLLYAFYLELEPELKHKLKRIVGGNSGMHAVFCKRLQQWSRGGSISTIDRFLDVLVKEGLSAKLSVSVPDHGEGAERKEDECISGSKGMCGACDVLKMFSKLTDSSSRLNSQGLQVDSLVDLFDHTWTLMMELVDRTLNDEFFNEAQAQEPNTSQNRGAARAAGSPQEAQEAQEAQDGATKEEPRSDGLGRRRSELNATVMGVRGPVLYRHSMAKIMLFRRINRMVAAMTAAFPTFKVYEAELYSFE